MTAAVSVIGLGKLGASMAAVMASRGFGVVGVDTSDSVVEAINAGEPPVQEPELRDYLSSNRSRIRATTDCADAVHNSDISFVVVPTPSDESGAFSLSYAANALRDIGHALRDKSSYHLVVLTSTVLPGATRYGLLPELEAASGRRCGEDFGLCYSPEFIALGSVIRDLLNPDFLLIGEYDEHSGGLLADFARRLVVNNAPIRRMGIENAELAKIALNAYLTTKITFANMLAEICERIPGGDVDVVSDALGLDSRVGRKYLTGALGFGGPCFPRDSAALSFFARSVGAYPDLPDATNHANRALAGRVTDRLRRQIAPGATVAVLGLSFKPGTAVIEASQGIELTMALARAGWTVLGFDPMANDVARKALGSHAVVVDSLQACVEQADVVVIATPDPVFLAVADLLGDRPVTVIDFWRLLADQLPDSETYRAYGRGTPNGTGVRLLRELWSGQPLPPEQHRTA